MIQKPNKFYDIALNWQTCSDGDVQLFKDHMAKYLSYNNYKIACRKEWINGTYIDIYIILNGKIKDHYIIDKFDKIQKAPYALAHSNYDL